MSTSASPMPRLRRDAVLAGPARWLSYAAAPAFAAMAVVAGTPAEAAPMTCLGGMEPSFLGGMAWMYVLMSVFHLPPWLRLLARRSDRPSTGRTA